MTKKQAFSNTIMVVTPKGKWIFMTVEQYESHDEMKREEERKK